MKSRTWEFKVELSNEEIVVVKSFSLSEAVAKVERMFKHQPNLSIKSCISTGL